MVSVSTPNGRKHSELPQYMISIILVSYNTSKLTRAAIKAIYQSGIETGVAFEIIVVDNESRDDSVAMIIENFPEVTVISAGKNLGFGRGNTLGAEHAKGDILFFLNTDTEVRAGAIEALWSYLVRHSEIGIAAAMLENPDGSVQPSILRFPTVWRIFCEFFWLDRTGLRMFDGTLDRHANPECEQVIEVAHGAAFMIYRKLYEQIKGFDSAFFMYYEESDLCKRALEYGVRVGYTPSSRVMHHVGGSSRSKPWWFFRAMRTSRMIYAKKHLSLPGRAVLLGIVHTGYALRILLYGLAGVLNQRLRHHGRNMLLSYIRRTGPDKEI
ncbi:MAG: glycosyltransferase family 2 protein [Chlorobi bacterium]|nr:glycosyltransferase family 2 protein [Chlorobiota bacterium]